MFSAPTSSPIIHISTHLDPMSTPSLHKICFPLSSESPKPPGHSHGSALESHFPHPPDYIFSPLQHIYSVAYLIPLSSLLPCPLALAPVSWLTISEFIMASETLPALAHSPEGKGSHSPPGISTWSFPKKLKFSLFLMAHSDTTVHPPD